MDSTRTRVAQNRPLQGFVFLILGIAIVLPGCSGGGPPPPGAQLNVEEIASWYNKYRAKHNGQAPPNEEAFMVFVNKTMKEEQGITEGMRENFLISPRDQKKFVVVYGKPRTSDSSKSIVVYEQEGYAGKKWMAAEMGSGKEVTDEELKQVLAGK